MSGLGVALEASAWGFDVLVLEREQCARATSANSLRIVHGGLRYLQSLDLPRLLRSASAQSEILEQFADSVRPLECVMPIDRFGPRSRLALSVAASVYSMCAKARTGRAMSWGTLGAHEAQSAVPLLRGGAPHGAFYWTDAIIADPASLVSEVRSRCEKNGARIEERSEAVSITRWPREVSIGVQGPSGEREVRAKLVVNAAGPWVDIVRSRSSKLEPRPSRRWAIGFNVLLDVSLEEKRAVGLRGPSGRLFFVVPRDGRSVLGTGYVAVDGPDSDLPEEKVSAFLDGFNALGRAAPLGISNVTKIEKGALPIEGIREDGEPILVGRERILVEERYVEILSTKLTTFLVQGREALRRGSRFLES